LEDDSSIGDVCDAISSMQVDQSERVHNIEESKDEQMVADEDGST
jgi:hypothetical protein